MDTIRVFIIALYFVVVHSEEAHDFIFEPNFSRLVHSKYYLDKTLMIRDILMDLGYWGFFVAAPPQFCKTVNLQMMKHFFEIPLDGNHVEIANKMNTSNFQLFRNSKFYTTDSWLFETHFGQYPVMFIDYEPTKNVSSYEEMLQKMTVVIANTCTPHRHIANHQKAFKDDLERTRFLRYCDSSANKPLNRTEIKKSFYFLAKILFQHYRRKAMVLVDNYFCFIEGFIANKSNATHVVESFELYHQVHSLISPNPHDYIYRFFSTGITTFNFNYKYSFDMKELFFYRYNDFIKYFGMTKREMQSTLHKFTKDNKKFENYFIHIYFNYRYKVLSQEPMFKVCSVLKYLECEQHNIPYDLDSFTPQTLSFVPMVVSSYEMRRELILLLHEKNVRLDYFTNRVDEKDIIDLRRIVDKKRLAHAYPRQLIYTFFLKFGYLTFRDSEAYVREEFLLQLHNSVVKSEIRYVLQESLKYQYKITDKVIDDITTTFGNVNEVNFSLKFANVIHSLRAFFRLLDFDPKRVDMQCELYCLLCRKFNTVLITEVVKGEEDYESHIVRSHRIADFKYRHLDVQFENNGLLFFIESRLAKDDSQEEMRECIRNATTRVIDRRRSEANVTTCFFIGLCFNPYNKTVGFAFSKLPMVDVMTNSEER